MENTSIYKDKNEHYFEFLQQLIGKVNDQSRLTLVLKLDELLLSLSEFIEDVRRDFGYGLLEELAIDPNAEHLKHLSKDLRTNLSSLAGEGEESFPMGAITESFNIPLSTLEECVRLNLLSPVTVGKESYTTVSEVKQSLVELQILKSKS